MIGRVRSRFTILLGVALAGAIGVGQAFAQHEVRTETRPVNPLSDFDLSTLKSALERPLFSPTRTADTVPEISSFETRTAALPPPQLRLLGVVSTANSLSARVVDEATSLSHSLREGQVYEEWRVASITTSSVTLMRGEREVRFAIFADDCSEPRAAKEESAEGRTLDPVRTVRVVPITGGTDGEPESVEPQWDRKDIEGFFGPSVE